MDLCGAVVQPTIAACCSARRRRSDWWAEHVLWWWLLLLLRQRVAVAAAAAARSVVAVAGAQERAAVTVASFLSVERETTRGRGPQGGRGGGQRLGRVVAGAVPDLAGDCSLRRTPPMIPQPRRRAVGSGPRAP